MNKAELLKQLRMAHEKQLWDEEAVGRVLDEYAEQESRESAIEFIKWLKVNFHHYYLAEDSKDLYNIWFKQQEETH